MTPFFSKLFSRRVASSDQPQSPPAATSKIDTSFSRGNDARNGRTSSLGDSLPKAQSSTINVVLFGEAGVGKSSVVNLIARKEVARVSSDVHICTMQYNRYPVSFDRMDFAIFDTIGLDEPRMGVNGYLKAIEKAYELISKLSAAGGIHLLLFCMRGGKITATTQRNYQLFYEYLCHKKVPIALVFTGLERETRMEDWWERNNRAIEEHYGIKSDDHACVSAVRGGHKYIQSQERIREVLKNCARKNESFSPESSLSFARVVKGMRGFVTAERSPTKRDLIDVFTRRCGLDPETAKKIVHMMENGDAETG